MLRRFLLRQNVPIQLIDELTRLGIATLKQLYIQEEWDMSIKLNISIEEYRNLLSQLTKAMLPQDQLVTQLDIPQLRTTIVPLDRIFHGGIPVNQLIEICGVSGIGKTCVCLGIMLEILQRHETVLYFDAEHKFDIKRLVQIATSKYPERYQDTLGQQQLQLMLNKLRIIRVNSSQKFLQQLSSIEEVITSSNVKLIVIDSITSLVQSEYEIHELYKRQHMLTTQASRLKYISSTFLVPVIVTNRASTKYTENGQQTIPALGTSWSHCVNTRILMEQCGNSKQFSILKSPMTANVTIPYSIGEEGILALDEAVPSQLENFMRNQPSDVLEESSCTSLETIPMHREDDFIPDTDDECNQDSEFLLF